MAVTVIFVCLAIVSSVTATDITIQNHWQSGFNVFIAVPITEELTSWRLHLVFDHDVNTIMTGEAEVEKISSCEFVLTNRDWNAVEHTGQKLTLNIQGGTTGDISPSLCVYIEGMNDDDCGTPVCGEGSSLAPRTTGAHGDTTGAIQRETTTARPAVTAAPVEISGDGVMEGTFSLKINWGNRFEGELMFHASELVEGFVCTLNFNMPVSALDLWIADVYSHSDDMLTWTVINKQDHMFVEAGEDFGLHFFANVGSGHNADNPSVTGVCQNKGRDYNWTIPSLPNKVGSKYNYDDVLYKSILFYETQRSGKLPADNRIPYRGDSALNDKGANGEDLTGGWYDAGDHVKFNFPMAFSTTVLTWGLILYKDAYEAAGQLDYMYDSIKWPLDYLLKCHTGPNELYVQVGNAGADHSYWGPPELMTMARPAFKIDASHPGSDVAMETAAAMAAGSIAFAEKDPDYSAKLLEHAKQIWEFAKSYQGLYSDSVSAADGYYKSYNLSDEMGWGSLWLHKATHESKYLDEAIKWFDPAPAWGMSWDEKIAGNQILLYQALSDVSNSTGNATLKTLKEDALNSVKATYTYWFPGGKVPYSPKGLPFRLQWGSLRYASNMAMVALISADSGVMPDEYRHWAMCIIHYALGDTGFSYLIGFGDQGWAHSPHHRSSSCPNQPAPCGPFVMSSTHPNVHTLYGALVGGPDQSDAYTDLRSNYVNNEVACDYNAGFQTAVAALRSLYIKGEHPEQTASATCPYH